MFVQIVYNKNINNKNTAHRKIYTNYIFSISIYISISIKKGISRNIVNANAKI